MFTPTRKAWIEAWEGDLTISAAAGRSAARLEAKTRASRYYTREATARVPEPARETVSRPALRPIRVATSRRPHWGAMLLALVLAGVLVTAAIVAPVLINSAATGLESEVGRLEAQQHELAASTTALAAQISSLSSPERVAEQAARLGLGPAQSVEYVDIDTETAATEADTTVAGR